MRAKIASGTASSDRALLERFRRGDPAAAEALARPACRLALRTAAAILGRREEAADIAQDVAVDVLGSLGPPPHPGAFDAWVPPITAPPALPPLRRPGRP